MSDLPVVPLAGVVLRALAAVLVPFGVAWWTGRRMVRLAAAQDPLLPELLLARQRQVMVTGVFVFFMLTIALGAHFVWVGVLVVAGTLLGSYPLRRELFELRLGPGTALRRSFAAMVAGFGLWFLLAWAPLLVLEATPLAVRLLGVDAGAAWMGAALAGSVMGVALLTWSHHQRAIWLRLHGACAITDTALLERFAELARRAGIAMPDVYRIGEDSHQVNAFALPSLRGSVVAFTARLLDELTPDEVAAIFAHELAHLEQHDAPRMRRARRVVLLLVLLGVGAPVVALRWAPAYPSIVGACFPVIVILSLARRVARAQQDETESDLRAVALTGDAPTVARALMRIHTAARIPRRWPQDFERRASHPSLARRVQAIRAVAAPDVMDAPALPIVLRSTNVGSYVVLERARAYWLEGVSGTAASDEADPTALRERASSYRAVAYGDLVELRLSATRDGRTLVARDRNDQRWELPLVPEQIAEAQRALDLVDVQLAAPAHQQTHTLARLLAVATLAVAALAQAMLALVPALFVLWRPAVTSLAALGAMALASSALLALHGGAADPLPFQWGAVVMLALVGAIASHQAWRRRAERPGARTRRASAVLLAMLCVIAAILVMGGAAAVLQDRSLADSAGPAHLAIVLLGIGAAQAVHPQRARRVAGALAGVAALAVGAVGVGTREHAAPAPAFTFTDVRATLVASVPLDGMAYRVELSPSGARYAVAVGGSRSGARDVAAEYDDDDAMTTARPTPRQRYAIGRVVSDGADSANTAPREIEALDVAYPSDDELLVLDRQGDSLELRLVSAARTDSVRWRVALPTLARPTLSLDRASGGWAVVEVGGSRSIRVASGTLRAPRPTLTRHTAPSGSFPLLAFDDGSIVSMSFAMRDAGRTPWSLELLALLFDARPRMRAALWHLGREARRVATLEGMPLCGRVELAGVAQCVTNEIGATGIGGPRVVTIDRTGAVTTRGAFPARSFARAPGRGALVAAQEVGVDGRILLVDGATQRGLRAALPADAHAALIDVQGAPGVLAALSNGPTGGRLALYQLE